MRFTAALVVVSLIAAACAADNPQQTDDPPSTAPGTVAGMLVASDLDRLDPSASSAAVERVTTGLAEFAADLYVQLADDGNMVFSPVSVYTALAMAYAGAVGSTADEMAELLAGGVERDEFQAAMNVLDQTLESRNRSASEFEGAVELSIANSLWGQDGMAFEQAFLDALATNYGSGMRIVDFIDGTAREEARLAINAWVAGETNDRIEDLIAAGVLDAMVRLVLVNAVYLNAAWATPFEEAATADQRFTF